MVEVREPLHVGKKYKLYKTAYENNECREFVIDSLVGYGATSVVYNAYYEDEFHCIHRCRLKECFPVVGAFEVRVNNAIEWISTEKDDAICKFNQNYKLHLEFQGIDEFVNPMSKIADSMLYGNGTQYLVMEYDYGVSFDCYEKEVYLMCCNKSDP